MVRLDQEGNGYNEVANGYFARGSTVFEQCFSVPVMMLQVQALNSNAWAGEIMKSSDGGNTYSGAICTSCTYVGSKAGQIAVDTDSNANHPLSTSAWCFAGSACEIDVSIQGAFVVCECLFA